eukprot:6192009-Pleurochrysis_carterae.AAC.1
MKHENKCAHCAHKTYNRLCPHTTADIAQPQAIHDVMETSQKSRPMIVGTLYVGLGAPLLTCPGAGPGWLRHVLGRIRDIRTSSDQHRVLSLAFLRFFEGVKQISVVY